MDVSGDTELTEGFSVVAAFLHYFTPQVRGELLGSYGQLNYDRAATGVVRATQPFGIANPGLVGSRFGFVDTEEFRVEASAIWSPVRDLDIGVDVLYQNIDPKGRVIGSDLGAGGGRVRAFDDQDVVIGRLRIQRDF